MLILESLSLTVFSSIVLLAGLWLASRAKIGPAHRYLLVAVTALALIGIIIHWIANYFTGRGIDEATIYHLRYGLGGAGFYEYRSLIVISTTGTIASLYFLIKWLTPRSETVTIPEAHKFALPIIIVSLLANPTSIAIYQFNNLQLFLPETSKIDSDNFATHYKVSELRPITDKPKNLIFIYAESLERTYFDQDQFPGLIRELRKLEESSTYFTNIKQVDGTGWTIGGIAASQCGVPLYTPSHGNSMSGMDEFLASAVCLGDQLSDNGYTLNYLGGAKLNFAGKGKFLTTHGFSDTHGVAELSARLPDPDYKNAWGIYDDTLFEFVYERFLELSEQGRKFGLFTLTLDTHHPNGHLSKSCGSIEYKDGRNPILNAVACSDYLISDLVNKIFDSPFGDQTVIVIASDHLAMRNSAYEQLKKMPRRNLLMILDKNSRGSREISALGSTLDIATTILPHIGYTGNIGLGRNLVSESHLEAERKFIQDNLEKWRQPITALWDFPMIRESLSIDLSGRQVRIDNRSFSMPLLITLNEKLETNLKFQFDKSASHKSLVDHRRELEAEEFFVLVDTCRNTRALDPSLGNAGYCLLAGKGNATATAIRLKHNVSYDTEEIRFLMTESAASLN